VDRNDLWSLKYAKRESLALLRWMYSALDAPCLRRKRELAAPFLVRRDRLAEGRAGRW
jgi:hypothetical protein